MSIQITITSTPQLSVAGQAYQQQITAGSAVGMDQNIFVMKQRPLDPTTGVLTYDFDHVATPTDLTTIPVNAPIAGGVYFRIFTFTQTMSTPADAADALKTLIDDVNALVRSLTQAALVGTSTSTVCAG